MLKLHKMQNNHLVGFFLKRGVKINLRNAYLKQHDSNSITGTGLSGTNEMASSPLYFIALHHLLWRASVVKQGGVASHQADRQPLEEPGGGGGFFFSSMSCQGTPQFSHLGNGRGVPGTKAFHCQGEKDDALPVAGFPRLVKLSLVGNRESMARSDGSFTDHGVLEWVDDSDINSHILATCPARNQHISWPATLPREQEAALLGRCEGS